MKKLFFIFFLTFCTSALSSANTLPAVIFSQDVVAINADGSLITPIKIEPATMAGMQTLNFDLGRERQLRIQTNISDAEERGLAELVAVVKRCYQFLETATGRKLDRGVMLYLIEVDENPYAYSFRATFNNASRWSEVRLALVDRGAALSGLGMPASLSDLLYDTLPHELGHDVLSGIPQLLHDIDGDVSNHTRWFIEGICEILAKGFSRIEAPELNKHFLSLRNIGDVLAGAQMRTDLLNWAQDNDNSMAHESDLYGAAMLAMLAWTETITLADLLKRLEVHSGPVSGIDLVVMMQMTTGLGPQKILNRAHAHGRRLNEQMVLAWQESEYPGS